MFDDRSVSEASGVADLVLRVGGYAPLGTSHATGLEVFADEVRRRSDHRIKVDIMENILDTGRPATDLLGMVESGELTMCYFSTSYLGDRVHDLNVLETPFLFTGLPQAHRALDGALGRALTAATEASTGFRVLGYWDNGFRHLTNRIRPIRVVEDCRGMRVRLQPNSIHQAMVSAWGAVPVPVELSRGIEMIGAGDVDAQENPLANTVAYGVDRIHRHVTMTAHLYGARGLYAHAPSIDRLDDRDREVVKAAARAAVIRQREMAAEVEARLRARLEDDGVAFVDPDPSEIDSFRQATAPVIDVVRRTHGSRLFDLVETE